MDVHYLFCLLNKYKQRSRRKKRARAKTPRRTSHVSEDQDHYLDHFFTAAGLKNIGGGAFCCFLVAAASRAVSDCPRGIIDAGFIILSIRSSARRLERK